MSTITTETLARGDLLPIAPSHVPFGRRARLTLSGWRDIVRTKHVEGVRATELTLRLHAEVAAKELDVACWASKNVADLDACIAGLQGAAHANASGSCPSFPDQPPDSTPIGRAKWANDRRAADVSRAQAAAAESARGRAQDEIAVLLVQRQRIDSRAEIEILRWKQYAVAQVATYTWARSGLRGWRHPRGSGAELPAYTRVTPAADTLDPREQELRALLPS